MDRPSDDGQVVEPVVVRPRAVQPLLDILGDARRDHVSDEESGVAALCLRQHRQRLFRMRAAAIGKDEPVGDLAGQGDHPLAQGDSIVVLGRRSNLDQFRKLFEA